MLTQLSIQNFGLIEKLNLDFHSNLNILTGETGAGKSIVIGALRISLGEKLLSSQIRDTNKPCVIEAVFDLYNTEAIKSEVFADFCADGETELIIHRSFSSDGRKKIKINGMNVTVSQLKEVGAHLMDFHGPHDHQMLLSAENHLGMLDRLVKYDSELEAYTSIYNEYKLTQRKINELAGLSSNRERELDLLSHQVKELEQVSLENADYENNQNDVTRINHAQKLNESVANLINVLDGDDGTGEKIRQAFSPMHALNRVDESTMRYAEMLEQLQETNEQLLIDLKDYAMSLSFDEITAQEVNDKADAYYNILKKFGPTIEDARKFYIESKDRLELLANLDHNDEELKKNLKVLAKKLDEVAAGITKKRKTASTSLKKTIEKELTELGINDVKFEVKINKSDFSETGADHVEFYISPNAGEDLKPLAKIVSSGEAARVMLALKKALIKVDPIPVLIFDEIDAQIGGRLGTITGKKLKEIAQSRQVLLITHLPQIASFADAHFKVSKSTVDKRAQTKVVELNDEERVAELAEMMSGDDDHALSLKHAADMLASAAK